MTFAEKFILLPRSVFLTDAWRQATGDQVKAYLDLCFRVAYCESEYKCRYGNIKLQKGQMVMSYRNLADEWKINLNRVRSILNYLKNNGLVTIQTVATQQATQHFTQYSILTINDLCDEPTQQVTQQATQDNNNNLSNDKSVCVKRAREKAFVIPSVAEIQQYLDEKAVTTFSAEDFYNYYESVGWMVGPRKKMKSWHGAVGTWISNRKQNNRKNDIKTNFSPHDRKAEAAQRHQEFTEHIIRKLNGQEQCPDELPFQ